MNRCLLTVLLMGLLVVAMVEPAAAQHVANLPGADDTATNSSPLLEAVLFYIVGGMVALSALGCVLSIDIVRMAMFLFATLAGVAILYFLMAACFLGAIQLIVYAGGTLIVIIFGVMLTSQSARAQYMPKLTEIIVGAIAFFALFVGLAALLAKAPWSTEAAAGLAENSVADIGQALLTTYLVPFELVSVLLLAAMIGAAYLARPEKHK